MWRWFMSRELEVQQLCKLILETTPEFDHCDNSSEKEHWYCPFCCGKNFEDNNMAKIKHYTDCEYSIAKGLMTNIIAT